MHSWGIWKCILKSSRTDSEKDFVQVKCSGYVRQAINVFCERKNKNKNVEIGRVMIGYFKVVFLKKIFRYLENK